MNDELKHDLEVIAAASPGPWTADDYPDDQIWGPDDDLAVAYDVLNTANLEFICRARERWPEALMELAMWHEGICPADMQQAQPDYDGPELPGCDRCQQAGACTFQRSYSKSQNLRQQIEMFLRALDLEGGVDGWLPKDLSAVVKRHHDTQQLLRRHQEALDQILELTRQNAIELHDIIVEKLLPKLKGNQDDEDV